MLNIPSSCGQEGRGETEYQSNIWTQYTRSCLAGHTAWWAVNRLELIRDCFKLNHQDLFNLTIKCATTGGGDVVNIPEIKSRRNSGQRVLSRIISEIMARIADTPYYSFTKGVEDWCGEEGVTESGEEVTICA